MNLQDYYLHISQDYPVANWNFFAAGRQAKRFLPCKIRQEIAAAHDALNKIYQGFLLKVAIFADKSIEKRDLFRKIIVTRDTAQPWYDDNGILTVSVYDFLLDRTIIEK